MIKLIVTDMDGTLLNDKGYVPSEFFPFLDKLLDRGIIFVVASGRQYYTLTQNIKPFKKDIFFIAENGSLTMKNDEVYSIYPMRKELTFSIISAFQKIRNCDMVLCGRKSAYTASKNAFFIEECKKYYHILEYIEDPFYINDDMLKIAVYDFLGAQKNSYDIFHKELGDNVNIMISEEYWLDFAQTGVNKGIALGKIQDDLGIKPSNTMVFGDFYNDIPMFSRAQYSYAMNSAPEDVKAAAAYICHSSVIETLTENISFLL